VKTIIIITGPTASGKTAASIQLAKKLNTSIISADSRQCYKELAIGVARPSEEELREVPHYFIASHSIKDDVTAITFEEYALEKASGLFESHDQIVMVGGTGLYIKAFCEGLDEIPEVSFSVREKIIKSYDEKGLAWLQEEIRTKDPDFYTSGEIQNPQRMMRALEVVESTGQSIFSFRKGKKAERPFAIKKFGIQISKEELHVNIDNRVDEMIKKGLVEEARTLLPYHDLNALQTVGYKELFDHFDGKITLEQAIADIKNHTRQYAKRQMTWFKRDEEINWVESDSVAELFSHWNNSKRI